MDRKPRIPDFELLRLIGRGSYGDVWLARGITGGFRAIKVVWRDHFEREKSFEREFGGIRRFEPISRHNPGLVDVLHVGRNAKEAFYYYVMELADDSASGGDSEKFNPVEYTPRTLATDMAKKNPEALRVFLDHGETLCGALHYLHERGLAHRDVKPSNIIFVEGVPKLADIGLVAATGQRTYVGTEGYIPPEGPGTEAADIYSLGMVLYEVMTGNDRLDFPELPAEKNPLVDAATWRELNSIVCRACAPSPGRRYPSAKSFGMALENLRSGKRPGRIRKTVLAAAAAGALVLGLAFAVSERNPEPGPIAEPGPPSPAANTGLDPEARKLDRPSDAPRDNPPGRPAVVAGAIAGRLDSAAVNPAPPRKDDPGETVPPDPPPRAREVQPRTNEPWTNSVGMEFRPEGNLHVSAHPTEKLLFDRFIDEENRALVGEVITTGGQDGGAYRHIIAVPRDDALAFIEWIRRKDIEQEFITDDHYYRIKPVAEFTSLDPAGKIDQLAFRCVLEKQEYGSLEITTQPPGATILSGEEIIGKTPYHAARLKAGPLLYRIRLKGYKKLVFSGELPPNGSLRKHFGLEENGALVIGKPWENSLKMKFVPVNDVMISIWETRRMDFDAFAAETGRPPDHISDIEQEDNHPVVLVNREDAIDFCRWLTDRERGAELLETDEEYRLPTDLEWSQAVGLPRERGKDPASRNQLIKGVYPWGYLWPPESKVGNFADRAANRNLPGETFAGYDDGYAFTSPVGAFPANALGLYDLEGNVWEWIAEPFGGTVEHFQKLGVVRGGSWSTSEKDKLLSSCRNAIPVGLRDPIYGFRCVIGRVR
ncbi:MAG: SUMF1/EgtB/PvdO family nonheme iron enzyme [Verrucomicrobiales bacterium]